MRHRKSLFQSGDSYGNAGLFRVPEGGKYDRLVIFLHGLGDTASGWESTFEQFLLKDAQLSSTTKIILPTAPTRPISLNKGMPMPAWFDIYSLDMDAKEDAEGLIKSRDYILGLLEKEIEKGVSPRNIIVGGFSQGGATAYLVILSGPYDLGAGIICSGWLPLRNELSMNFAIKTTQVMHCHGKDDDLVAYSYGEASASLLKENKVNIVFKTYSNVGHWLDSMEMDDMLNFLRQQLFN